MNYPSNGAGFLPWTVSQKQRQGGSKTNESLMVILDTLPPYLSFVYISRCSCHRNTDQSAWFKPMLILVLFLVVLLIWGEGQGWTMPSKKQLQLKLFRIPGLDTSDLMLFFDDNHVQDEVPPLGFRGMMKISKWQVVVWETPGDKKPEESTPKPT